MKNIFKFILPLISVIVLFSCTKEEIDVAALTDFPPGILSITPANASKVVKGDFDVKVEFADGTVSPLSEGTVTLTDAASTQLATATKSLSGTEDFILIAGSSFNASSLDVGSYTITISVTDAKGQTTNTTSTFEISNLPFAANNDHMYLSGGFNGWGADEFTLVADYTWELLGVNMDGGEWKLKNCENWCDQDWGDSDCDGLVINTTGGGPNSACSPTGLVNIRFNDQTLRYTISPAVIFATNISGLYLLGEFNAFQGGDYKFNLVADNTWVLNEVQLKPGVAFKFAEYPTFMGRNWGDNELDGKADEFGSNIVFSAPQGEAFYKITFNDKTLEYTYEFVKFPAIGIIGSATPGGWDTDTDMTDPDGDGTFEVTMDLVDGEAKFRANHSWDTNWGAGDFPSGTGTLNGPNIPVPAGHYKVTFTPSTGAYNFEVDAGITTVGLIGSATPGGWDTDTNMKDNGDGTWSLVVGLIAGEAKFRANDAWDVNWGAGDFPSGTGTQNGANIPVAAGLYLVTFNSLTGAYSFAPASIGLIGSATAGGWDTDTNLDVDAGNPAIVTGTLTLTDGEAKFRANDDWTFNWGGAAFPSGTGTQDGPNIPVTAGTYTITFNVNTGEYSFN
ncbi:MAG: SusF/SusE family outer membrane protein [Lewinella sp.]|nr:SusF/SusE family outer membrane protein [Lewinella sp.]